MLVHQHSKRRERQGISVILSPLSSFSVACISSYLLKWSENEKAVEHYHSLPFGMGKFGSPCPECHILDVPFALRRCPQSITRSTWYSSMWYKPSNMVLVHWCSCVSFVPACSQLLGFSLFTFLILVERAGCRNSGHSWVPELCLKLRSFESELGQRTSWGC